MLSLSRSVSGSRCKIAGEVESSRPSAGVEPSRHVVAVGALHKEYSETTIPDSVMLRSLAIHVTALVWVVFFRESQVGTSLAVAYLSNLQDDRLRWRPRVRKVHRGWGNGFEKAWQDVRPRTTRVAGYRRLSRLWGAV